MIQQLLHRPGPWRKQRAELALRLRGKQAEPQDWLEHYTGEPATYWVDLIQASISETWEPNPKDPDHPLMTTWDWLEIVGNRVVEQRGLHARGHHGDENIGTAIALSLVFGIWACRISRAKAFDPRRPVQLRQAAYRSWLNYAMALASLPLDEAKDPEMFDQPWESPFLEHATDGSFV